MGIYKAVVSTWTDGLNPEDAIQITPTFRTETGESGLDSLAQEILTKWNAYLAGGQQSAQKRVTLYSADCITPPCYPVAMKEHNVGVAPASTTNRDIALCLSYYSQFNRPRFRGRLYVPMSLLNINAGGARPSAGVMTAVGNLATVLAGIGNGNVTWGVYSKVDREFKPTTHWWVGNSWDSQRRRGQKQTDRIQAAIAG